MASINIRTVAKECNVSIGSVYYYFPSKVELVVAIIEEVWKEIFHMEKSCMPSNSFPDYVTWIFDNAKVGLAKYPNFFFVHSMNLAGDEKGVGRKVMEQYFSHINAGLLEALQRDDRIKPQAFSKTLTHSDFVDFVFSNLFTLFVRHADSCTVLMEIIRRIIY